MSLRDLEHRLKRLERGSGGSDAVLRFSDGKSIAVNVRDPLGLVLASFRREHARDMGKDIPESRYSRTMNLLSRAVSVSCDPEPLIGLAHNVCRGGSDADNPASK
jgi:hypothetical protein